MLFKGSSESGSITLHFFLVLLIFKGILAGMTQRNVEGVLFCETVTVGKMCLDKQGYGELFVQLVNSCPVIGMI